MEYDREELDCWLTPFLAALHHKVRARMCAAYVAGLLGVGARKNAHSIAGYVGDEINYDRLHHFVAAKWDLTPLERELIREADRTLGGANAFLVIQDIVLPKKGRHSIGVASQKVAATERNVNSQVLVSLGVSSHGESTGVGLRLFLPESWISDPERLDRSGVPLLVRSFRDKVDIALDEIDQLKRMGLRFGYIVADVSYGRSSEFRQALNVRQLPWVIEINPAEGGFLPLPPNSHGKDKAVPPKATTAGAALAAAAWHSLDGRSDGWTKGMGHFAAIRTRLVTNNELKVSGGENSQQAWGDEVWLVGEQQAAGARRCYISNLPPDISIRRLAGALKARQLYQKANEQLKNDLGLNHYEGRSWHGLHRHALMTMIALLYLKTNRLGRSHRKTSNLGIKGHVIRLAPQDKAFS